MKTKKRKSTKITVTTKAAIPAKNTEYAGAPIPATKVYARKMKEFRNCQATCLLRGRRVGSRLRFQRL